MMNRHTTSRDPSLPITVLHVSGRSDHGGGPEHIRQVIAAGISDIRHCIACPRDGLYWSRFRDLVGEANLCHIPHRYLSPFALYDLRSFARDRDVQVVHSHGMSGGFYGRALGLLAGIKVVHSFHGVPVTPGFKHRVYQVIEPFMARLTTCGIAVSASEADIIHARWRGYRGKLAVVPNGIELGEEPPWSAWPTDGQLRLVSFSRLNRQKNPEALIDLASALRVMGVDFHLDAYGEGLDRNGLASEADRRQLTGLVAFHGPTDHPAQALAGAHIYVSTSRWEGMPLAILEAWRAGLVVVASDVAGNKDLIEDKRTGRLFHDIQSAAHIIRHLGCDPVEADALRRRAAQRAHLGHSRDLMAMRLEWLYRHMRSGTQALGAAIATGWPKEVAAETDAIRVVGE